MAIFAFSIFLWDQMWCKVLTQVLDHEAGFCNDQRLGHVWRFDLDDWRLSQWMDLLHFCRRKHVFAAFEHFDLVVDAFALFQKP